MPPDPAQSLFKYVFTYNKAQAEGMPSKMYSLDYPKERKMFPGALHPELKKRYRGFIGDLAETGLDILVDFFGNCYPVLTVHTTIELWYVYDDEMESIRSLIQNDKLTQKTVIELARKNEILWAKIIAQRPQDTSPMVSMSPKYHPKLEVLNGMKRGLDYWVRHLTPKGLIAIKVYDNRCVHSDNLIKTLEIEANIVSMVRQQEPQLRGGMPRRINTIYGNED